MHQTRWVNFESERTHSITSSARASSERRNGEPDFPNMRVTYLDATEHPGTVQVYKIMPAPGIVINGELAIPGASTALSNQDWT